MRTTMATVPNRGMITTRWLPPRPIVGQHHLREEGCSSEIRLSCGHVNNNNNDANDEHQQVMASSGRPCIGGAGWRCAASCQPIKIPDVDTHNNNDSGCSCIAFA
jgi:hypothetical protein